VKGIYVNEIKINKKKHGLKRKIITNWTYQKRDSGKKCIELYTNAVNLLHK